MMIFLYWVWSIALIGGNVYLIYFIKDLMQIETVTPEEKIEKNVLLIESLLMFFMVFPATCYIVYCGIALLHTQLNIKPIMRVIENRHLIRFMCQQELLSEHLMQIYNNLQTRKNLIFFKGVAIATLFCEYLSRVFNKI